MEEVRSWECPFYHRVVAEDECYDLFLIATRAVRDEKLVKENCFLMPTDGQAILNMGTASLPMLDALGLEKIKARFLPAEMMFSHYIAGTKVDLDELNL